MSIKKILSLLEQNVIKEMGTTPADYSPLENAMDEWNLTPLNQLGGEIVIFASENGLDPQQLKEVKEYLVRRFNNEINHIMQSIS
jgi:hypothetical protein